MLSPVVAGAEALQLIHRCWRCHHFYLAGLTLVRFRNYGGCLGVQKALRHVITGTSAMAQQQPCSCGVKLADPAEDLPPR